MRLITLNIWGGRQYIDLLGFLKKHKKETDIFCFQEIFKSDRNVITPNKGRSNILNELKKELEGFEYLFSPTYHGRDFQHVVDYPLSSGNGIFWKKSLTPKKTGTIFTHYSENEIKMFPNNIDPDRPINFQYFKHDKFMILNIHGYWNPAPKSDVPERIEQSEKLINFIKKNNMPSIIAGDFNLRMNTKSVKILEDSGLRNLVREAKALTTRTALYDIKWRKNDKYADYIFSSKGINVYNFKVMKDVVSDHSPLLLDFET